METCPSKFYTPVDTCKELLKDINFRDGECTLEACKGRDNNFYDLIPYDKDWGEIELGRDLFTYDFKRTFNRVITNPPYRDNKPEGERKNICMNFIFRCLELCDDECWLLLNYRMWNSLTPVRLNKIREMGFNLSFLRIIAIKKWYGRYYWCCFKKNGKSIIEF